MKRSKFAVLACMLVCAILACGLVSLASAATPKVKVVVTPSNPAVKLNGSEQYKAKVTGVKGATVIWSWKLDDTSQANGCTISQSGLLTIPDTITPDSWTPVVTATATYQGTSTATGTASFAILDNLPAPGLFMGTISCTGGSCSGENINLAMNVKKGGAIDAMGINGTYTAYKTFPAAIILKKNEVLGTCKISAKNYILKGQVEYDSGTAVKISGLLYAAGEADPIGTWEVEPTTTGLAKVGTFAITDIHLYGKVINGTLAGMVFPASPNTFYGLLEVPEYNIVVPASGTFDESSSPVTITFSSTMSKGTITGKGTESSPMATLPVLHI